jgi:hypothetical protein
MKKSKGDIRQVFHSYENWECYKAGFFSNYSKSELNDLLESVRYVFSSSEMTEKYMRLVISNWPNSTEQNLTNLNMNRVAWLGQAACCFYGGVPHTATMYFWKFLKEDVQRRSDRIANQIIKEWEQNRKLKDILENGSVEGIQMEFQTKPQQN